MSSTNFAAAQERIFERRRLREAEAQARRVEQRRPSPINSTALQRLPYPLSRVPGVGWSIWDSIRGRDGTRPAFRVGQVDAELLDEELLGLMKNQVGDALKYFGPQMREEWSHEILFALRAILFKLSIWDHNASYGAALQGLRYTDSRSKGPVHSAPTKSQKTMYGLLTVGGRYAWDKWESWLVGQEGGYEEPSQEIRIFSRLTDIASTTHSVAALISFLVFLVNGRYRTLVDRLLRIRLTPPSAQASREVSFEYLNRQLVWHAFTEFLLFLLPLVGISRWKRWISRAWRRTVKSLKSASGEEEDTNDQGELAFLPERTCAICYRDQNPAATSESEILAASAAAGISGSAQTDITNPYETIPCGCVYCFVCIVQKLEAEEGQGWVCLRCGELVKKCRPWNGDVLEETRSQPGTGKIVGFAIDNRPNGPPADPEEEEGLSKPSALENVTADEALHSNQWNMDEKHDAETEHRNGMNGFADRT
ncbi:Peroxisome biogenesis factor N-terminal domain-containing protein [Penicillium ucsense]|uniref:Peroxisome biogenesis factor N-terminal domain-containing protein n=1 Tax=Penicillium ucsense TaxID=2839758 RepID=A0A8J8WAG2_9EURO|nr:Peroxisome biogenesis factor N-terminal domain-containing protein [Penicillium ucsense]KAF7733211.1 Peroxisome biogenesis factor N-terminal domain-containing protein [Penicillium ucsense]